MSVPDNVVILDTRVARTSKRVRTVFLGRDCGLEGAPVFFDTLIEPHAPKVNVVRDEHSLLYGQSTTWAQALATHDKAIAFARRMAL